jgi:hypothetical protein
MTAMPSVGTLGYPKTATQMDMEAALQAQQAMRDAQVAAYQNAFNQQQASAAQQMARYQQLQNQIGASTGGGALLGLGAIYGLSITTPSYRSHACHTACGCNSEPKEVQVIQKTWAETKPAEIQPPLSLKTSPLMAAHRWGGMVWRFDSPFKPLHDWLIRWAWETSRRLA